MDRHIETLRVTWKMIRRSGYPSTRTPQTYCDFIIENEKHKHRRMVYEKSELFKLLSSTTISKNPKYSSYVIVEGIYNGDKLIGLINPKKIV
jgi:hypothetical protein